MDANERNALKTLPRYIQHIVNKIVRGSTADIERLYNTITAATPLDHLATLLPVFFLHLDPSHIPTRPPYTSQHEVLAGARWSLMGVYKILIKIPHVEDKLVYNWDRVFPWMQFFHVEFLLNPTRSLELGIGISPCEIAGAIILPLSSLCQGSEATRHMMRSKPALVTMVVQLWTLVTENLIGCNNDFDSIKLTNMLLVQGAAVKVVHACIRSESPNDPDNVPFVAQAVGGIPKLATTALKYIRLMTQPVRSIRLEDCRSGRPASLNAITSALAGFADAAFVIDVISHYSAEYSQMLIARGSIKILTTSTVQFARRLRILAERDTHDDPNRAGLTERRKSISLSYSYLNFSMKHADDGVTVACMAIKYGLLEAIILTGVLPPYAHPDSRRVYNSDVVLLWQVIPYYFVYESVLSAIEQALAKLASRDLESYAVRDNIFWEQWKNFKTILSPHLRRRAQVNALDHPFCGYQCVAPDCPNDSTDDVRSRRCSGCLISVYCSKACQRADWKSGHRIRCKAFRKGLGSADSRHLRRSLPLLSALEADTWKQNEARIEQLVSTTEAQRTLSQTCSPLLVEISFRSFPAGFSVHSLEYYCPRSFGEGEIWLAPLWEWQRKRGRRVLSAIKIADGPHTRTILSPSAILETMCGWPG